MPNRVHSADTFAKPRNKNLRAASCSLMIPKTGSTNGFLRLYASLLTHLNLRTNDLTDSIPADLGQLGNLTYLNLHSNQLSGSIPDLSMTVLEELYLANNYDETA